MSLLDFNSGFLWAILAVVAIILSLMSAGHALLRKRDPRSAAGWIAVCLLLPVLGVLAYWL